MMMRFPLSLFALSEISLPLFPRPKQRLIEQIRILRHSRQQLYLYNIYPIVQRIQYSQWYTEYLNYKNKRFIYNTANDIQNTWNTITNVLYTIQPMIYRIPEIQEQTFYIQYSQWYTVYLKYKNKRLIYHIKFLIINKLLVILQNIFFSLWDPPMCWQWSVIINILPLDEGFRVD